MTGTEALTGQREEVSSAGRPAGTPRLRRDRPIVYALLRLFFRIEIRLSNTRRHHDLMLVADNEDQLDRVEGALRLIEQILPVRYRQIGRDLRYVWIRDMMGYAEFNHWNWACSIQRGRFSDPETRNEDIALILVHEATHARLSKFGFGYDEALRARIEAICHRRELAFAKRLGDEQAIYRAGYYLENQIDYSNEAVFARDEIEIRQFVSKYGLPLWIGDLLRRMRRWNERSRKRLG